MKVLTNKTLLLSGLIFIGVFFVGALPSQAFPDQLDGLATCNWNGTFSATFYSGELKQDKARFTIELRQTGNIVSGTYEGTREGNPVTGQMRGEVSEYVLDDVAYSEVVGTWTESNKKSGTFWFRRVRGINWNGKSVHDPDACTQLGGGMNCKSHWDNCEANIAGKLEKEGNSVSTISTKAHPLCDEAFSCFDKLYLDKMGFTQTSNIKKGHIELLADFEKAIADYDQNHAKEGKKAYVSKPLYGGLRAINWLGNEGGMMGKLTEGIAGQALAQDFVFEHPDDVAKDRGKERLAKKGTEPALYWAITQESESKKRPLTVGEIFYLSLEQRNGDAREAMLLAHNTLRSLARPEEDGRINDVDLTGVEYKPGFFNGNAGRQQYIEVIREDHATEPKLRDNGGPVYHIFGTAFFEMQMQGDIGVLPSLLSAIDLMTVTNYSDEPSVPLEDILPLVIPFKSLITEHYKPETAASRVANAYEQYLRTKGGKVEDPEKYCFNIWAARIGSTLWEKLGGSLWSSPWGNVGAPYHELHSSGMMGFNLAPPENYKILKPLVKLYKSPISVAWEAGGNSMLLDQETQSLHGYYPGIFVIPFYEESSASWGAITFDFSRQAHKETYKASKNGDVHILSIDLQSKKAAAYEMAVLKGETYTMDVKPGTINPNLVRSDGKIIGSKLIDLAASSEKPATPVKLYDNGNVFGIEPGAPTHPTTIFFTKSHNITLIQNYHWNRGRGAPPGLIWLVDQKGQKYGPWKAAGVPGSGGVPNAYWKVSLNVTINSGIYTVKDSDPATWSKNSGSQGSGITHVEGI